VTRIVAQAPNAVLAALWLGVLERAGIPAYLADQQMAAVYPGILGGIKVVVRDEDYDEARRLLDEAQAGAADEPDPPAR
jgi:hypothetical protein